MFLWTTRIHLDFHVRENLSYKKDLQGPCSTCRCWAYAWHNYSYLQEMNTMWCGFDWLFLLYGLYCPCCKLAEIWRKTGQYSHLDMFKSLQEYRNINTGIELVNVFYWLITCWWPRCSHVSVFGPLAAFMEQVKWSTVKHVGGPLIFRNMMLRVHPHIFGSGASSQGSFFPPQVYKKWNKYRSCEKSYVRLWYWKWEVNDISSWGRGSRDVPGSSLFKPF